MSTELTVQEPVEIITAEASGETLSQVPHMQASLLVWCRQKQDLCENEAEELWVAYKNAEERKWKTSTLKRHANLADQRKEYYEKLGDALEAGYCVFPTMDCDVFALRTDRDSPKQHSQFFRYSYHPAWEEKSEAPASGEGDYVNPIPAHESYDDSVTSPTKDNPQNRIEGRTYYTLPAFDKIQFPLSMSKPHIMDAVGKAIALKIFDEIGIIGDKATSQSTAHRRRDPLIVGRVLNPKKKGDALGMADAVTFLISWHIETRDLEV